MEAVFLKLLNMSITASWLVLAVIVLRLLLKNAPKAITVVLWALVGVRLIIPFSIESVLSLIPSAETVPDTIIYDRTPEVQSGIPAVNAAVNPVVSETFAPSTELTSVNPMQVALFIASILWIIGMVVMVLYTFISYYRVHRKVREAMPLEENIWLCDRIDSPFILGAIRPRIYLPSAIDAQDMEYVIAHEKAHLKRRDHWWKPLGFFLLTVYWFNPLLWVAYVLLCKDIELACDEKVIVQLGLESKKPYSNALINCSMPRKMITACPLAFGEVGVKGRIKSVLHYKKPAFWVIVLAVIVCIIVAVCFLTNPADAQLYERSENDAVDVQSITVETGGKTYELVSNGEIGEVLDFLSGVEISSRPISEDRSEDRDKSNAITVHYDSNAVSYYFSVECASVWVNDGVKPSLTNEVKNPEYAKSFFAEYVKMEVNDYLEAPIDEEIERLRQTYPQFFDLPAGEGLRVYIWKMAESTFNCYICSGSIPELSWEDIMIVMPISMAEARMIVDSYELPQDAVEIAYMHLPHSNYSGYFDYESAETLFWSDEAAENTQVTTDNTWNLEQLFGWALSFDGAYTEWLVSELGNAFQRDPQIFLNELAKMDMDTQQQIVMFLVYERYAHSKDAYAYLKQDAMYYSESGFADEDIKEIAHMILDEMKRIEMTLSVPVGAQVLTEAELEEINGQWFGWIPGETAYKFANSFLVSTYTSPQEIDLFGVFHNGYDEDSDNISAAERDSLGSFGEMYMYLDVCRTERSAMDALLKEYTGYGLEDIQRVGIDSFAYLESYDAYYLAVGDTAWSRYTFLEGYRTADGQLVLLYQNSLSSPAPKMVVTLQSTDNRNSFNGYWFVSNLPFEE